MKGIGECLQQNALILFNTIITYLFTKGITQMAGSIQQQLKNRVSGPRISPRELQ